MKLLSIIVSYNSQKWIEKNISSVFAHTLENGLKVDVMLVDNGSTDETPETVKQKFPDVKIIETGQNLGFAKANNIAFDYALKNNYDYVFLVNHDGWLLPHFWENVAPVLKNNTAYGLLSPFHYDNTEKEFDYGFMRYLPERLTNQNPIEIELINGAFLLISQACLKSIKGFDPIFFFYGEDTDLCFRAKKKGFKIGLIKDANVVHDRSGRGENSGEKNREWYGLLGVYLVQLKLKYTDAGFNSSFYKTIFSVFIGLVRIFPDMKNTKYHLKLIFFLWRNKKELKRSYYLYN